MPHAPMAGRNVVPALFRERRWWLVLLLVWAGAAWMLLSTHVTDIRQQSIQIATEGARNMLRMVVLTRSWNASHGGVYVPVTPRTQPNPYLRSPRRDVTTTDGQALTLINPAYMTRLIGELAQSDTGAVFRLTSLRPIRPENAADAWEHASLQAFESGTKETLGIVPGEHGMLLRYMAPLMVEAPCLQCHAHQGYQLGDIRGGISVSQNYTSIEAATESSVQKARMSYGLVFVITTALGWLLLELLRKRWTELAGNIVELETTRGVLVQSEKMASLGRMVAGFAHEINTPVGVAVGAVSHNEDSLKRIDTLLEQEDVSEEQLRAELASLRQSATLALANLRRASTLVQSFKRTSMDQTSEQVRSFELKELIGDVLFALQSKLKRLPVEVRVDCADLVQLQGMPGLLEQLLTNLVLNAVEHGFDGGQHPGAIDIAARLEGSDVHLSVSDNGQGMDSAQLHKIFEPFFTTRRAQGGSGLGLYICYNIVTTQLGGTIHCHSAVGEGCRFDIRFPARMALQHDRQSP